MSYEVNRYVRRCLPESPFYAFSAHASFESGEQLSSVADLPSGWTSYISDVWRVFFPLAHRIRTHGWKVHVSATPENAPLILKIVSDYCFVRNIAFKYLSGPREYFRSNAKEASRASSGKFITIYPGSDQELSRLTEDLDCQLQGQPGPYILSDVRYRKGPLFFRYGAFIPLAIASDQDDDIAAIPSTNGRLIEDQRIPRFIKPLDVDLPPVVAEAVTQYELDLPENELDRYTSIKPLHFSNGGGVYKAIKKGCG